MRLRMSSDLPFAMSASHAGSVHTLDEPCVLRLAMKPSLGATGSVLGLTVEAAVADGCCCCHWNGDDGGEKLKPPKPDAAPLLGGEPNANPVDEPGDAGGDYPNAKPPDPLPLVDGPNPNPLGLDGWPKTLCPGEKLNGTLFDGDPKLNEGDVGCAKPPCSAVGEEKLNPPNDEDDPPKGDDGVVPSWER